jgi:hypothetical protein
LTALIIDLVGRKQSATDSEGRYVKSVQLNKNVVKLIEREVQNWGPALLEHILTGSVARTGRGEV